MYCSQSVTTGRRSQYDIWPNPVREPFEFLGRPCIYVGSLDPLLTGDDGGRAALAGLRAVRTVELRVRGHVLRVWTIFVCDRFAGFAPAG